MERVLVLVSEPTSEPVILEEAKIHLGVTHEEHNSLIERLISSARRFVESVTYRQLITATYRLDLSAFPAADGCIELPKPPLGAVSSITYYDEDNAQQTLAASVYEAVSPHNAYSFVRLKPDQEWPDTFDRADAVSVNYTAGYGTADQVPETFKAAILMLVGTYYHNRETVTEAKIRDMPAFKALISTERARFVV